MIRYHICILWRIWKENFELLNIHFYFWTTYRVYLKIWKLMQILKAILLFS